MDKLAKHFPKGHVITCGDDVVDQSAPGGRRISISLYEREGIFHKVRRPSDFDDMERLIIRADTAIGLNTGIASYLDEWSNTMMLLLASGMANSFWNFSIFSVESLTCSRSEYSGIGQEFQYHVLYITRGDY